MADATVVFDTSFDASQFTNSVKNMGSGLKDTQKALGEVAKAAATTFGERQQRNIDAMTRRLARQNEAIDQQKSKVAALKDEHERITSGVSEPKSLIEMERALQKNQKETEKLIKQMEELKAREAELKFMADIDRSASGKVNPATTSELKTIGADIERLYDQIDRAEHKSEQFANKIKEVRLDPSTSREAATLAGELELATNKLARLGEESQGVKRQIEQTSEAIVRAESEAEQAAQAQEAAARRQREAISGNVNALVELNQQYTTLMERTRALEHNAQQGIITPGSEDEVKRLTSEMVELWNKMDETVREASELNNELKATGVDPSAADGLTQMTEAIRAAKQSQDELYDSVQATGQGMNSTATAAAAVAPELIIAQEAMRVFGDIAKNIGEFIGKSVTNIFNFFKKQSTNVLSFFKKLTPHVENPFKAAEKWLKKISSMLLAVFVFNAIRSELRSLRDYFSDIMKTNERFVASLNTIKVNLMTAFQPIYEAALPALNALMSALATATTYLATFIAMLSGQTYEAARASAKAINEQAEALKNTGSAAGKASKSLASFDKINKQSADSSGGSDAGNSSLFDIAETPTIDLSWLEEFRDKLLDLIPDLEYFENLGAGLAEWITNGLNSIPWGTIQAHAESIGAKLAAFFNGLLGDPKMWMAVGHTLAEGFDTAVAFLSGFISTFRWRDVGTAISKGVNQFFIDVEWDKAGTTLKNGFIGVLNMLDGFIDGLNTRIIGNAISTFLNNAFVDKTLWDTAGDTLSSGFNKAVSILHTFIRGFKWDDLGKSIASGVNKFIRDTDWDEAGRTLYDGLTGVFSTLGNFLVDLDANEISKGLKGFLDEIKWVELMQEAFRLAGLAIGAAMPSFGTILQGVFDSYMDPLMEMSGDNMAASLLVGLANPFMSINLWLNRNVFGPLGSGIGLGLKTAEGDAEQAATSVADAIAKPFNELVERVNDPFKNLFDETTLTLRTLSATSGEITDEMVNVVVGNYRKMREQAIDEIARQKNETIDNLKYIFQEEVASLEEKEGKIQAIYDERLEAIKSNVDATEAEREREILNLESWKNDQLQIMRENVTDEERAYLDHLAETESFYDDKKAAVETAEDELRRNMKEQLLSGETLNQESLNELLGQQDTYHESLVNATVDDANERDAIIKKRNLDEYGLAQKHSDDIIADAELERSKAKAIADERYDEQVAIAEKLREDGTETSARMAAEIIENAEYERDKAIAAANERYDSISEKNAAMLAAVAKDKDDIVAITDDKFSEMEASAAKGMDGVDGAINKSNESIKGKWGTFWTGLYNAVKSAVNSIIDSINGMIKGIASGINAVIGMINGFGFTVPEWVPGYGGNSVGFSIPTISSPPQIPRLANGGLIQPNHPRTVIVGDNTREEEIVSPVSTMKQAFMDALEEFNGGLSAFGQGSSPQPIILELDRRELGRVVVETGDEARHRSGVSLQLRGVTT